MKLVLDLVFFSNEFQSLIFQNEKAVSYLLFLRNSKVGKKSVIFCSVSLSSLTLLQVYFGFIYTSQEAGLTY